MLDTIKYAPLEIRKRRDRCTPGGPSFERSKAALVQLPTGSLQFRAPRHAPKRAFRTEQISLVPGRNYDLSRTLPIREQLMPSRSWKAESICSRSWAFYGPWFTGYKGDVDFCVELLGTTKNNPDLNFLYPAALETAAQGYITALWGHEIYDKKKRTPYYQAPINWTPINTLPVPAIRLNVEEIPSYGSHRYYVFFPVAKDALVAVYCSYGQACSGNWEKKDATINPEPFVQLVENIIASVRFTPNPELQREIDAAKAACRGDYAVSSQCQPFHWPADVDKDGLTLMEYKPDRYTYP